MHNQVPYYCVYCDLSGFYSARFRTALARVAGDIAVQPTIPTLMLWQKETSIVLLKYLKDLEFEQYEMLSREIHLNE